MNPSIAPSILLVATIAAGVLPLGVAGPHPIGIAAAIPSPKSDKVVLNQSNPITPTLEQAVTNPTVDLVIPSTISSKNSNLITISGSGLSGIAEAYFTSGDTRVSEQILDHYDDRGLQILARGVGVFSGKIVDITLIGANGSVTKRAALHVNFPRIDVQ